MAGVADDEPEIFPTRRSSAIRQGLKGGNSRCHLGRRFTQHRPFSRLTFLPWLTLSTRRLSRWCCRDMAAGKPARAAHAPEPTAGSREAVLAETEPAASATQQDRPAGDQAPERCWRSILLRPTVKPPSVLDPCGGVRSMSISGPSLTHSSRMLASSSSRFTFSGRILRSPESRIALSCACR
jgi:hypothetical protein